jgi:ABC-2 type transport system permease protein
VLREIKGNLKSLLIWSASIAFVIIVAFSEFSAYYNNPEMLAILDSVPKEMLSLFYMDAFNLTTLNGFLGVMYAYIILIVSIHASMLGGNLLAKEEKEKTIEFFGTLPITRKRIVISKFITAVINVIFVLLTSTVTIAIVAIQYKPDTLFYEFLFTCMSSVLFIQLVFLSLGFLVAGATKYYNKANQIALTIPVVFYIMSIVSGLSEDLKFLKKITPFTFFNPIDMIDTLSLDITYVMISSVISIGCIIIATVTYAKRDLNT